MKTAQNSPEEEIKPTIQTMRRQVEIRLKAQDFDLRELKSLKRLLSFYLKKEKTKEKNSFLPRNLQD